MAKQGLDLRADHLDPILARLDLILEVLVQDLDPELVLDQDLDPGQVNRVLLQDPIQEADLQADRRISLVQDQGRLDQDLEVDRIQVHDQTAV